MRLTGPHAAQRTLALIIYGRTDGEPVEPGRWLRRRTARESFAARAQRLLIGHLVRRGGTTPAPLFDAAGEPLGTGPAWHASAVAAADWRLSGAVVRFLGELWERTEPGPPAVAPVTAADTLFFDAVAEALDAVAAGRERGLAEAASAASPLTQVRRPDRADPAVAVRQLGPLLAAGWLAPYLIDGLVRDWLELDRRREMLRRGEEETLNRRLLAVWEGIRTAWTESGRHELLVLFARLYERWLRSRDGLRGILRGARAGAWDGWTQAARESFELSYGRLFEPGLAIRETAADLRALGWQRTPAAEYFLGEYARRYEPHAATVERLHAELCRIV